MALLHHGRDTNLAAVKARPVLWGLVWICDLDCNTFLGKLTTLERLFRVHGGTGFWPTPVPYSSIFKDIAHHGLHLGVFFRIVFGYQQNSKHIFVTHDATYSFWLLRTQQQQNRYKVAQTDILLNGFFCMITEMSAFMQRSTDTQLTSFHKETSKKASKERDEPVQNFVPHSLLESVSWSIV